MTNQIHAEKWLSDSDPEFASGTRSQALTKQPSRPPPPLDFDTIYEEWFDEVARWVRVMGGPLVDHEDLVQEVFVVVHRRLEDFDGENLPGWLYQIARRKTRDYKRLRWVRHLVRGRSPMPDWLSVVSSSPSESLETKQKAETLARLLTKLNADERSALLLFEIEGYSGERIAEIQGVKVNTVWGRIYSARRKLKAQLSRIERSRRGKL